MSRLSIMCALLFVIGCGPKVQQAAIEEPPATENEVAPASFEKPTDNQPAKTDGLTVTPRAAARVRELIAAEPARNKLRISIVDQFQGELRWQAAMIRIVDPFDDETFETGGITIVVDRATRPYVAGVKVDYVEKNGRAKFTFEKQP